MEISWTSEHGARLLADVERLAGDKHLDAAEIILSLQKQHKDIPAFTIGRAVEIVRARKQIAHHGEWTRKGLFSRASVEQASHPEIAKRHARRFRGCEHVLEICSGIGFDTAGLAREARKVTCIELSEELSRMARHNLTLQGITNVEILTGKAEAILPTLSLSSFDGLWADPSRRNDDGTRIGDPEEYHPSLSMILALPIGGPRGIKISPGYNFRPVPAGWVREWIGFNDECREQVLWSASEIVDGTAFLADSGTEWRPGVNGTGAEVASLENAGGNFLIEPHAALIRTGCLAEFFAARNISLIDPEIAYGLASVQTAPGGWYEQFKIIESFAFNLKELNRRIRALEWSSRTEIKRRGFPMTPDEVRRKLKFSGGEEFGTIIITRQGMSHFVILAKRLPTNGRAASS